MLRRTSCESLRGKWRTRSPAETGNHTPRAINGLHAKIISVSTQLTAASTIQRLRGQAVRFQFQLARQPGRPSVSLPQHLAIIDAVCRHDPDGAAEAMRLHLESVADAIRATNV
ncbi:MAG: hypothetical protein QOH40_1049 [Arthrobacter pascens]|nr:hypothetical protein [Arthrobacter pascens]